LPEKIYLTLIGILAIIVASLLVTGFQRPQTIIITTITTKTVYQTITETRTKTTTYTTTKYETTMSYKTIRTTTTVIKNITVYTLSQDPDISIKIKPVWYQGLFIEKIRIYITNNGNTTKYNLLLVVITENSFGYKTTIKKIDELDPGTTLQEEINPAPATTKYYITILQPRK